MQTGEKVNNINDLREWDTVIVTGQASSPIKTYNQLKATIATISENHIKVWPEIQDEDGKIWFDFNQCQVTFIDRDEEIYGKP